MEFWRRLVYSQKVENICLGTINTARQQRLMLFTTCLTVCLKGCPQLIEVLSYRVRRSFSPQTNLMETVSNGRLNAPHFPSVSLELQWYSSSGSAGCRPKDVHSCAFVWLFYFLYVAVQPTNKDALSLVDTSIWEQVLSWSHDVKMWTA